MFTKETGAAAYAFAVTAGLVVLKPRRDIWPLLVLPATAVLAYLAVARIRLGGPGWVGLYAPIGAVNDWRDAWLNTNLADASIRSFLADIFVLNFQWLFTAVVIARAAAMLLQFEASDRSGAETRRAVVFFSVLLVGLVYITTRYRPYNNARYVLMASPGLIVVFYSALVSLVTNQIGRVMYLTVCALLVFWSNFRTVDIVSASIFGTFPFGTHRLLDMPSLIGGVRADSIVYNLEFLQLQYLYADVIRDLRPRPGTVVLMGAAVWNFPPDVDGRRYTLTANPSRALPLIVNGAWDSHLTHDGEPFYYAAFANADNGDLAGLKTRYPVIATTQYRRRGYTLDLYTFRYHLAR
jgi:hypothetical protein